jgi:phosphohistidine phosphatase
MDDLYLAPGPRLLELLRKSPETARSVLLIGHNPGLHDLALSLAGPAAMAGSAAVAARRMAEGFPTCSLAEFVVATPWRDLAEGGGRLVRFLVPADLPETVL